MLLGLEAFQVRSLLGAGGRALEGSTQQVLRGQGLRMRMVAAARDGEEGHGKGGGLGDCLPPQSSPHHR